MGDGDKAISASTTWRIRASLKSMPDKSFADARGDGEMLEHSSANEIPEEHYRLDLHPAYLELLARMEEVGSPEIGGVPYFRSHQGLAGDTTRIGERDCRRRPYGPRCVERSGVRQLPAEPSSHETHRWRGQSRANPSPKPKFPVRWENTGYSLIFGSISPNLSSKSQS